MKKRDEKDMNYESNITIIRREYNEERVSKNLRARIEFFKKNKRAPKRSKDKEEQRLYDSYRRLNLEDYYNLDKYLLEENKMIDAYDLAHKDFYKRQKSINSKRNYISKVIKNYYEFYLENNRFASDVDKENKLERKISKDYNGIICYKKYYTKEHLYYINMINEIKKNKRNRENLQKIKKYINFCLENSKVPVHFSSDSKNIERKKENRIAINLEKLNLDDIVIPNALLNELYDVSSPPSMHRTYPFSYMMCTSSLSSFPVRSRSSSSPSVCRVRRSQSPAQVTVSPSRSTVVSRYGFLSHR